MLGLMRAGRNMKLSPDPTHRCRGCRLEWILEPEDPLTCDTCYSELVPIPRRTLLQKLPEALLIASLPVLVMGSAVLLLKLLELLFR